MRFETVKLDSLLEVLTDYHANGAYINLKNNVELLDSPNYAVMIRTTNFERNEFDSNLKYITAHAYNFLAKSKVYAGDIIMNKIANAGSSYLMPDLKKPVSLAMNLFLLRINSNRANPTYVYIYLKIHEEYVKNFANGSVTKTITKDAVRNLEIKLPERWIQNSIVNIYCSLSKKIELNRQTNQTLEQIAQALFKSWFVDFEPTRAKIAAKEAGASPEEIERAAMCAISGKTPDQLDQLPPETRQNLKTTAALFPDALVESELGEVPEGWEVSNLKSVTTEIRRGISPAYVDENGVCVINQKCIRNHKIDFSLSRLNDPIKKKVEDRLLQVGDVLVNSTGVGTLGRLAPIRYLLTPTVHDSHVTVVRANTNEISNSFLIGLMLENETFIEASGIGSTGQTELNRQVLENISFAKPTLALSLFFESMVEPMTRQIAIFEQQESSLVFTRDTLLPKLLSSELGT